MALTYLLLIARACLHDAACVFFSPHAPCWHPSAAGRMLDTPGRGYRALGPAEGIAPSRRTGGTCGLVQCASLSLLIVAGVAMLATRPQSWPALPGYSGHSSNATHRGRRYGKRRAFMSLGRMGTSSSFVNNFVLRSRRPKQFKAQKAKAATKSVVLVGSHFDLGNALLEPVFKDLCGRPRLGLRCDRDGATHRHDLKGLSGYKGRKRLVWMERDAASLLQTLRGVSKFAYDLRFIHVLWDPREACVAQWPLTLGSSNVSLPSLCGALRQVGAAPTLTLTLTPTLILTLILTLIRTRTRTLPRRSYRRSTGAPRGASAPPTPARCRCASRTWSPRRRGRPRGDRSSSFWHCPRRGLT